MTVYIEYVLIDNIVIDYLILKLSLKLSGNKINVYRLLISSVIGGVGALIYPLLNLNGALLILLKLLFGLLMVLVSAKFIDKKSFFIATCLFFLMTFALGGGVIGIFTLLNIDYSNEISIGLMILPVYALYKTILAFARHVYKKKDIVSLTYDIEITANKKTLKLIGFFDTGNGVYDGENPVIFCAKKTAIKFISDMETLKNLNSIEYSTVSGTATGLAIKIDELKIYILDEPNIFNNVTMCVVNKKIGQNYDVILHSSLIGGKNAKRTQKVS